MTGHFASDPFAANPESAPVDRLIHIADLHFWRVTLNPFRLLNKRLLGNINVWLRRRHQFAMAASRVHAQAVAAQGVSTVLLTGDFTSTALEEEFAMAGEFMRQLQALKLNAIVLPGNHDVYTFESVRGRRFERHMERYLPREGYPTVVELGGGTPLLLVPTVCPNVLSSRGRIRDREIECVRELLQQGAGPILVAGHYPVLTETPGYILTKQRNLRNAEALREALGEAGRPILYVAGHVHRFSYVQDERHPHLHHLTTGAFFYRNKRENIEGEFAEIAVHPNCFEVVRHVLRGSWEQIRAEAGHPPNRRVSGCSREQHPP